MARTDDYLLTPPSERLREARENFAYWAERKILADRAEDRALAADLTAVWAREVSIRAAQQPYRKR